MFGNVNRPNVLQVSCKRRYELILGLNWAFGLAVELMNYVYCTLYWRGWRSLPPNPEVPTSILGLVEG